MKKLIALSLLALLGFGTALAGRVSSTDASDYAVEFMQTRIHKAVPVSSVELFGNVYIVNLKPQGWVIVSSDDTFSPVIGYNTTGYLDRFNMPSNMKGMLEICNKGIRSASLSDGVRDARWDNAGLMARAEGSPVEPLIKVHWNQQEPYWKYCPKTGGDALVGCVAVATSQAMSVQRYPDRPTGSKTYSCSNYGRLSIDFDAQQPYDWDAIISGAKNYDEAARLMFHAGMAVEMMYGTEGSGVLTSRLYIIRDALVNHFKYKTETVNYYRRDQYRGDWGQLLLGELQAGCAVVYNGVDEEKGGGHSFNVDGFDGNGLFHVNWGWGGSAEGYFSLNSLIGGGYNFSAQATMVTGIITPNKDIRGITLTDTQVEEGIEAGSTVSAVLINGELPTDNYEVSVHGAQIAEGQYRDIPFKYEGGMVKTTREIQANERSFLVEVTAKHRTSGESMTQGFSIQITERRALDASTSVSYNRDSKTIVIRSKHNTRCTVTNAQGVKVVDNEQMQPLPQISILRSQLSAGANTVTLTNGSETKTFSITL